MKTRSLLLCGALAVAFSLSGCALVTKSVELSKSFTSKLTGADDPNNTSTLANFGRLSNDFTDQGASLVGLKPADTSSPVALATETAPEAVAPAPAASAAKAKKVTTAKKTATKPVSSVKPVATTTKPK